MKGHFIRTLSGLKPANRACEEELAKIKMGAFLSVEVKQPRHPRHLAKWWVLMGIIADNLPGNHSAEDVCQVLKIRIGHVTRIGTPKGIIEIPKSISFAAMDQTEFNAFWDRAVKCICEDIIPGLGKEELEAEVLSLLS
jgi:Protein of unknown function (DUF1367)